MVVQRKLREVHSWITKKKTKFGAWPKLLSHSMLAWTSDVHVARKSDRFPAFTSSNGGRLFHNPSTNDIHSFSSSSCFSLSNLKVGNILKNLSRDVELGARATYCVYDMLRKSLPLTYACIDRWVRCDVRNSSTQTGEGPLGPGSLAPVALSAISLRGTAPILPPSPPLLLKPQ